jgi:preprotein translocase subunit SecB
MVQLTKNEFETFRNFISNIELVDVLVIEEYLKKYAINPSNKLKVELNQKDFDFSIEEHLVTFIKYVVRIKSGNNNYFKFEVNFEIRFKINDFDFVKKTSENKNVFDFFKKFQLPKIIWPYLRAETQYATTKAGMKPFTLPFLK